VPPATGDDPTERETWKQLCEHRLFGETNMLGELTNQLWAHVAWLAWDGGGRLALLKSGSSGSGGDGGGGVNEGAATHTALSPQCVQAATRAAHDQGFGVSGDSGGGDEVDNGVLKFFITWTKNVAFIERRMQVVKRQHGPACQSYARLVAKHDRAAARLEQLNDAHMAMERAGEVLNPKP
jgi:hypothetical protein